MSTLSDWWAQNARVETAPDATQAEKAKATLEIVTFVGVTVADVNKVTRGRK